MKLSIIVLYAAFIGIFIGVCQQATLSGRIEERVNKLEAARTITQQPQKRHLFNLCSDSGCVFESCDTAVVCSHGKTRNSITFYYSK